MANGFLTSSPGSRHGDDYYDFVGTSAGAKFTLPGSGTVTINEIGIWAASLADATFHLAIFEHDSVNNCPGAMVANSDSGELTVPNTGGAFQKIYKSYSTKPSLTGGNTYWLCWIANEFSSFSLSRFASGGVAVYDVASTYATWPDDTGWHTHTDSTRDYAIYAVYDTGGGQPLDISISETLNF